MTSPLPPSWDSNRPTEPVATDPEFPLLPPKPDPLYLVESAFLASSGALVWLLSYTPISPFARLFYSVPVALAVLRWNQRTGLLTLTVTGLLLTILLGPTRSVLYIMPYGLLGLWCGICWQRGRSWYISLLSGAALNTFGLVFHFLLSSLLVGENLWTYLTIQLTNFTNWILDVGLSWLGIYVVANPWALQVTVVGFIALNSLIYVFTVHLVSALVMERLRCPLPPPPRWVQFLLE